MLPPVRRQLLDDIARNRAERDAYKSRASFQRKEYSRLNKARRFLDALMALDRYHEYRNTSVQYAAEVTRLRGML